MHSTEPAGPRGRLDDFPRRLAAAALLALLPAFAAEARGQELWGPDAALPVDAGDYGFPPSAGDHFGTALAADSDLLATGCPGCRPAGAGNDGALLVYERIGGEWQNSATFATDAQAGEAASVAASGSWVAFGAPDAGGNGRIFLHRRTAPGAWSALAEVAGGTLGALSSDFGAAVALDGSRLVGGDPSANVGAITVAGRAWLYQWSAASSNWELADELEAPFPAQGGWFGTAVAIEGDLAAVGEPRVGAGYAGRVHLFRNISGSWTWFQALTAPDGQPAGFCGQSVAIDGDRILVGCPRANFYGDDQGGVAYVFRRQSPTSFVYEARLSHVGTETGDNFGSSVALRGDLALVGARGDDTGSSLPAADVGSVTLFRRHANGWVRIGFYVSGGWLDQGTRCGSAVALGPDIAAWGCPFAESEGWDEGGRVHFVDAPFFTDGLERGDASAWSLAYP